MKKSFLFLFFVTCNLFALDDISIPYSFSPKDTIKASKFEANNSEIQTKFNKLNDSLELSFIRFSDLESGDSLLDKVRVDTLRVDNIRSNPNVDSISGDVRFTGAPTVNGVLTASGGVTGNVTGNVTGSISGGTVSGSTGTFSSTVSVDSIYSAKGINSARRITGTDLQVSDSVRGVTGAFSGALSGLSLTLSSNATIAGNINVGGLTASRIVETDATKTLVSVAKNTAYNKNFGTTSGTVCQGNDSRLSDARTILNSGSDWNTITDNRANTSNTNGPVSTSVFIGLNIVHDSNSQYRFQIMGRNNGFYVRTMENSTWNDYQKLWTEANDGTGSGLDADLLDGQHGSWYQQAIAGTANRVLKIQSDGTGVIESIISDDGTTAKVEGRLDVRGNATTSGDIRRLFTLIDLTNTAQGVGAGIDFQGKYNSTGNYTPLAGIKAYKANATDGNYSGELHFQTRKNGSNPITRWIIDEDGNLKGDGTIKADSINSTKGINCSTINTGFGNFEIGQNLRTTDAVTFSKASADTFRASKRIVSDSVYTRVSKVDSIQIGTSNAFSLYGGWYKEGSFACTLKTSDVTEQKIGTAYYTKIGNQVTIKLPSLAGTSNSTDLIIYCGEMPSILTPSTYIAGSIGNIRSGAIYITGTFMLTNTGVGKFFRIFKYDYSDFATSGVKGIDITSITYIN